MERSGLIPKLWGLFIIIFGMSVDHSSQYVSIPECKLDFCSGTSSELFNHFNETIGGFCNNSLGILNGRCCFHSNKSIGLDLSNCSLDTLHNILTNFTSLEFLDLSNNSLVNCSKDDFLGLVNLEYLYIPETCTCPGNEGNISAWNQTTSEECFMEKNPCDYLNVSCTDDGQCIHLGPGSAECVCLPHHYGYKCLREGNFPYGLFGSTMIASTAVLSGVLWYLVGRHAKSE